MDFWPAAEIKEKGARKMIFNSFLAGFISYVMAIIYNLLIANNLERVFFSGIKYLFLVSILTLLIQLSIYFIKTQSNDNDSSEQEEDNNNNKKAKESEDKNEDFSPLNPPEIEYEDQNEK